jgi:hypothetical protein
MAVDGKDIGLPVIKRSTHSGACVAHRCTTYARRTTYRSKKRYEHKSRYDDAHRNTFTVHSFCSPGCPSLEKQESKITTTAM